MVELREYIQVWRERPTEKVRDVLKDLEDELDLDERLLEAALEGGAVVERGPLRAGGCVAGRAAVAVAPLAVAGEPNSLGPRSGVRSKRP